MKRKTSPQSIFKVTTNRQAPQQDQIFHLFLSLPEDLQLTVALPLSLADYSRFSHVNKAINGIMSSNSAWRQLFIKDMGSPDLSSAHLFFEFYFKNQNPQQEPQYKQIYRQILHLIRGYVSTNHRAQTNANPPSDLAPLAPYLRTSLCPLTCWTAAEKAALVTQIIKERSFAVDTNRHNYFYDHQRLFESPSVYIIQGLLFLIHSQITYSVVDKKLVFPSPEYPEVFEKELKKITTNASLLGSSNVFFDDTQRFKVLCLTLWRTLDFGALSCLDYNFSRDLFGLQLHAASALDGELNEKEKKLKEELKQSVMKAIESDQSSEYPEYYYNMSCAHAIFRDFETSEKYFNECFTFGDGKFIGRRGWEEENMIKLYEDSRVDQDYSKVKQFSWFYRKEFEDKLKKDGD